MTLTQAIILGLVEGVTEFLPISSTAHLIISSKLLSLPQDEFVSFFEVFIQSGAILAVILLYWKTVLEHQDYIAKIIVSFIPTALIGFLMRDTIKDVFFHSDALIGYSLIIVAILFVLVEMYVKKGTLKLSKSLKDMTYQDAFFAGVIQAAAIVPGVSRAGAVIIGLMLMKYKRAEAAIYSFLLAIPTILGASMFDLIETDLAVLTPSNLSALTVGFVVSFISALVFIKWLIGYLQRNSLNGFALYRILIGLGVLFFLG